jgi:hypothetical protein
VVEGGVAGMAEALGSRLDWRWWRRPAAYHYPVLGLDQGGEEQGAMAAGKGSGGRRRAGKGGRWGDRGIERGGRRVAVERRGQGRGVRH